jgi:hypothetical protein
MNLRGSLFNVFWLLRSELNEVKGCLEFATFFENGLIPQEMNP